MRATAGRNWDTKTELWITQTGFSTWRGEERAQVHALVEAAEAPVERIYWQSAHDRDPAPVATAILFTPTSASITTG